MRLLLEQTGTGEDLRARDRAVAILLCLLMLGVLGLLASSLLLGCGPKQLPMPSIHERCQAAPQPRTCEALGLMIAADEAQPATIYIQPPQRQVVWPWPRVGGRAYPGNPIGYTVP